MVDKEALDEVKKGQKNGSRKSKGGSKKAAKDSKSKKKLKSDSRLEEGVTPNERPTRERKTVERYSDSLTARGFASNPVSIEKGPGTRLKEIPNVAFKLSKKKPDDNLQMLHSILFGKKTKTHSLKKNIGQFSGYVWVQDEQEKQREKVKERIDKCIKEKLLDFCDVLNIPIIKSHVKKEDLSTTLLEFLESPHATTDILLADKERTGKMQKVKSTAATKTSSYVEAAAEIPSKKGKKRKVKSTTGKTSSSVEAAAETPSKKQKRTSQGKKRKRSSKHGEEDKVDHKVEPSSNKDGSEDEEESMSEEEEDEPKNLTPSKKSSSKKSIKNDAEGKNVDRSKSLKKGSPAKSTKKSSSSTLKKGATYADGASGSTSKSKVSSTKKQKAEKKRKKDQKLSTKGKASSQTQSSKSSAKPSAKDQGKGKTGKKAKAELSKEEMYPVVADILNEVDFNTATLNDILRQLGTHFGVDLTNREEDVKDVITDVIHNMTDVEDEEEEAEAEDEGEKDGSDA